MQLPPTAATTSPRYNCNYNCNLPFGSGIPARASAMTLRMNLPLLGQLLQQAGCLSAVEISESSQFFVRQRSFRHQRQNANSSWRQEPLGTKFFHAPILLHFHAFSLLWKTLYRNRSASSSGCLSGWKIRGRSLSNEGIAFQLLSSSSIHYFFST